MIQTIACVLRSGGDFETEHVFRLREMCNRHIPGRWNFVCISDKVGAPGSTFDANNVLFKQSEFNFPGWWAKMEIFKPGMFDDAKRVLYFDLDTVIVRDSALGMWEGEFALLRDLWSPNRWNTGVMAFQPESFATDILWQEFQDKGFEAGNPDGDFVNKVVGDYDLNPEMIQDIDHGVCSFKPTPFNHSLQRTDLDGTETVVCFHGKPRPWEAKAKWIGEHWC